MGRQPDTRYAFVASRTHAAQLVYLLVLFFFATADWKVAWSKLGCKKQSVIADNCVLLLLLKRAAKLVPMFVMRLHGARLVAITASIDI